MHRALITLCGSTRFKREFEDVNKHLTLLGHIVLSVGYFVHAEELPPTEHEKDMLDELHKEKIRLSEAIYILNVGNYMGESTRDEIIFAYHQYKIIFFHEVPDIPEIYSLVGNEENLSLWGFDVELGKIYLRKKDRTERE